MNILNSFSLMGSFALLVCPLLFPLQKFARNNAPAYLTPP
jgi:hypothetical protein